MSSIGRKKDYVWNHFIEVSPSEKNKSIRARCKSCSSEVVGLVARMKAHLKKCVSFNEVQITETEDDPSASTSNSSSLSGTLITF